MSQTKLVMRGIEAKKVTKRVINQRNLTVGNTLASNISELIKPSEVENNDKIQVKLVNEDLNFKLKPTECTKSTIF